MGEQGSDYRHSLFDSKISNAEVQQHIYLQKEIYLIIKFNFLELLTKRIFFLVLWLFCTLKCIFYYTSSIS